MCTIIAAVGVWPQAPLVIATNRDEALDRAASGPQVWPAGEVASRRVLAPRDLRAGGTWLGLNERGLFVGITNRRAIPDPSRRSRGELVFTALGAASRAGARDRVRELDARDYNPFHLLFADRDGALVVWADGERLHEVELGPGVHWLTERSFGAGASERHRTLDRLAAELEAGPLPEVARWRSILADHQPHASPGQAPAATAVGLDAMCVHALPLNYGTRSSTLVELGPELGSARFLHALGRPCETDFVDHAEAVRELRLA
ncbi:hypothetical protein ENSA5_37770 [Enhygromyxa salina]|uniref:NRDE family protein n=1 Tax=Enhygromyxa salina TaxID=215803 RepID=A0A2S9XS01_9BACT|nr:NRDE family protein [Enhygromyxa salina]PRP95644.1 hypothetical protein ENSA5_37770 [Enhygromyxa salina]